MMDRNKPFNVLPELPPRRAVNTARVQTGVREAYAALERLNAVASLILAAKDFYGALLFEETTSHESIGDESSAAALAWSTRFAQDDTRARAVACYQRALQYGVDYVRTTGMITVDCLIELHRMLGAHPSSDIRRGAVRVGDGRRLVFTAPAGYDLLLRLLRNLVDYINHDPADPLIRLGVIVHQFIWILPFYDGNGRVSRLLIVLFLLLTRVIDEPVLFLNCYFKAHFEHYLHVMNTTLLRNDWEELVYFMIGAVRQTAVATRSHVLKPAQHA